MKSYQVYVNGNVLCETEIRKYAMRRAAKYAETRTNYVEVWYTGPLFGSPKLIEYWN